MAHVDAPHRATDITLTPLPPKCPELPGGKYRQFVRDTGSPIAFSNRMTISSTIAVKHGKSSPISLGESCPSDCANGRRVLLMRLGISCWDSDHICIIFKNRDRFLLVGALPVGNVATAKTLHIGGPPALQSECCNRLGVRNPPPRPASRSKSSPVSGSTGAIRASADGRTRHRGRRPATEIGFANSPAAGSPTSAVPRAAYVIATSHLSPRSGLKSADLEGILPPKNRPGPTVRRSGLFFVRVASTDGRCSAEVFAGMDTRAIETARRRARCRSAAIDQDNIALATARQAH